jgi:hypothetical protein
MQSVLSLMKSMVAAESSEWRAAGPRSFEEHDNRTANRVRKKSLDVADSTGEARRGTPHPGCFGKRVWICLIAKELTFLDTLKRPQNTENIGFATETPRHRAETFRQKLSGARGDTRSCGERKGRNGDTVSRTLG